MVIVIIVISIGIACFIASVFSAHKMVNGTYLTDIGAMKAPKLSVDQSRKLADHITDIVSNSQYDGRIETEERALEYVDEVFKRYGDEFNSL